MSLETSSGTFEESRTCKATQDDALSAIIVKATLKAAHTIAAICAANMMIGRYKHPLGPSGTTLLSQYILA